VEQDYRSERARFGIARSVASWPSRCPKGGLLQQRDCRAPLAMTRDHAHALSRNAFASCTQDAFFGNEIAALRSQ